MRMSILALVAKSAIIDRAVADAAFALKQGEISEPVQGRFGTVLVRVVKIEPEQSRPAEEIAREAKRNIALGRARTQLQELHDKIEDDACRRPCVERGRQEARSSHPHDRRRRSLRPRPRWRAGHGHSAGKQSPESALSLPMSRSRTIRCNPKAAIVWFDVIGVTPSRERTIEEVKDRVEQSWRNEQIAARLKTKAAELTDKLKSQGMAEIAAANGLKVETADKLKRGAPTPALPARVLEQIFRTAKGEPGNGEAESPVRVVFRVTDVAVPTLDPGAAETKKLDTALRRSLGEDLLAQYVTRLETDLGTTINQDALRTAIGGGAN